MSTVLEDAKLRLEADGLFVSSADEKSLLIADEVIHLEEGIRLSQNACTLINDAGRWVAVFPAEGIRTYEVAGPLPDSLSLIENVYQQHRHGLVLLKDAFRKVVKNAQLYLRNGAESAEKVSSVRPVTAQGPLQ